MLLEKAKDLGGRLEKAFSSPSGMPYAQISLATGSGSAPSWTGGSLLLAEVGTVQIEFFSLAQHGPETLTGEGPGKIKEGSEGALDADMTWEVRVVHSAAAVYREGVDSLG